MRPASVVSSVELETRKISEGKIIYILGPYADVRVYVCHMFVYLFVCSLGIAPFPLRFSLTCTLFLSARRGQQLWNTEEYPPDTGAVRCTFPWWQCTFRVGKRFSAFSRPKCLFAQMFAVFQIFDSTSWRMRDYLMGANVNVPYVAVGFDLVFCYSVLLTPHLHIVKLLENRWIIAFFSQLLGNWHKRVFHCWIGERISFRMGK